MKKSSLCQKSFLNGAPKAPTSRNNQKKIAKEHVGMKIVITFAAITNKSIDYEEDFIFTRCPDDGHDRTGTIHLRYLAHDATRCRNC